MHNVTRSAGIICVGKSHQDVVDAYRLAATGQDAMTYMSASGVLYVSASGAQLKDPENPEAILGEVPALLENATFASNSSANVKADYRICLDGCGTHIVSDEPQQSCPSCSASVADIDEDRITQHLAEHMSVSSKQGVVATGTNRDAAVQAFITAVQSGNAFTAHCGTSTLALAQDNSSYSPYTGLLLDNVDGTTNISSLSSGVQLEEMDSYIFSCSANCEQPFTVSSDNEPVYCAHCSSPLLDDEEDEEEDSSELFDEDEEDEDCDHEHSESAAKKSKSGDEHEEDEEHDEDEDDEEDWEDDEEDDEEVSESKSKGAARRGLKRKAKDAKSKDKKRGIPVSELPQAMADHEEQVAQSESSNEEQEQGQDAEQAQEAQTSESNAEGAEQAQEAQEQEEQSSESNAEQAEESQEQEEQASESNAEEQGDEPSQEEQASESNAEETPAMPRTQESFDALSATVAVHGEALDPSLVSLSRVVRPTNSVFMYYDGAPLGRATFGSVSNAVGEEIAAKTFETDNFIKAVSSSLVSHGVQKTIADFGFKSHSMTIDVDKILSDRSALEISTATDNIRGAIDETVTTQQERFVAALSTAMLGLTKGFWKDGRNPIANSLSSQLEAAGVKDPRAIIDRAFIAHGEDFLRASVSQAKSLVNMSEQAQNEIAQSVSSAAGVISARGVETQAVQAQAKAAPVAAELLQTSETVQSSSSAKPASRFDTLLKRI